MLWWIIGFIVALIALHILSHWRHGRPVMQDLIEPPSPPAPPPPPIRDPQLGTLTYSPDGKCWECVIPCRNGPHFELSISGNAAAPDRAALDAARPLAERAKAGELQASIRQQTANQAPSLDEARNPVFAAQRAEMLSLEPDALHIYSAGPPAICMVWFKEDPAYEGRTWRCSYDGKRATDFGFDS